MKNKKFLISILFWCLIVGGFALRFVNLKYNTVFDWDQENSVAFPAKNIVVNNHFPLIGPKTGVGDLYLAPLYTYLAALFYGIFRLNPLAGAVLAGVISIITGLTGFFLLKKLFGKEEAIYFLGFWAVSPFILSLDRIAWNVNLFPMSSLLVACGLWLFLKYKSVFSLVLAGLGILFGFSSHYTVIFLVFALIIYLYLMKKWNKKAVFILSVFFLLGILPIVLFNFRHDNLYNQNLTAFSSSFITPIIQLFARIILVLERILENIGKVFIHDGVSWFLQTIGILFLVSLITIRRDRNIHAFLKFYLINLAVYFLGFVLYSGAIPDYYFIGLMPLTIAGAVLVIKHLLEKLPHTIYLFIIFLMILFVRSYILVSQVNGHSLGMKEDLIRKIKEQARDNRVKIVYDMDLGWSYGYEYLADYYQVNKNVNEKNNIYWISFPASRFPGKPDFVSGELALGFPETVNKIYNTKQVEFYDNLFKVRIPKNWVTLMCPGKDFDKYVLTDDLDSSCSFENKAKNEIIIENIPECNISEKNSKILLKLDSGIPVYSIINNGLFESSLLEVPVIVLEQNRCIGFWDSSNLMTPDLINIFSSLKKN